MMKDDVKKVLLSEEELHAKVAELGAQITKDYEGKNLLLVTVLKGAVVFLADLMRTIDQPAEIDFMVVSSYGSGVKSSGVVKIVKDLDINLEGKDILIVEDILDSGMTLDYIKGMLQDPQPLFDPHLRAARQAGPPQGGPAGGLCGLHHPRRVRHRLRPGLR